MCMRSSVDLGLSLYFCCFSGLVVFVVLVRIRIGGAKGCGFSSIHLGGSD